jgi:xyloglucan:xyloglucosyl transferase
MDYFHSHSKGIIAILSLLLIHLAYVATAAFNVTSIPFNRGFSPLFGDGNVVRSSDDKSVSLVLNQYTGSGFKSSDLYNHGFFSARIKLPSEYTAGIVVAFYTTNGDIFQKTHDELDFEFLGNIRGKRWRFQTNVYGNGSGGREERYYLWFDPSKEFHRYSILWTNKSIIFYIDEVPIREIQSDAMAGGFPSKPMSLYATIWDASNWATSGGKYKVDYKYAPFVAEFNNLALHGCAVDPIQEVLAATCSQKDDQLESSNYARVTPKQRRAMKKFRQSHMYYSYCYDTIRYSTPLPECVIDPVERRHFKDTGRSNFIERHHHRHSKRRSHVPSMRNYGDQDED